MIELKVTLDPNDSEATRKRTAQVLRILADSQDPLHVADAARPAPMPHHAHIAELNTALNAAPITDYIAPEGLTDIHGDVATAREASTEQVGNIATDAALTPVDKDGLPWDRRIHSDAAERLTKEGYWKRRRNIDDATVATVEAELRALMAIPAAPVATFVPQEAGTYTGAVEVEGGLVDTDTGEFTPSVPTPPAPPAPPAPAATKPVDFAGFMRLLTPRIQAKELTHVQVNEALAALDLKSVPQLAQRTDLIPSVVALLGL